MTLLDRSWDARQIETTYTFPGERYARPGTGALGVSGLNGVGAGLGPSRQEGVKSSNANCVVFKTSGVAEDELILAGRLRLRHLDCADQGQRSLGCVDSEVGRWV
jgi:hypothetical protein